jgi:hypothetical protein
VFVFLLVECRFKPRIGFHVVATRIDSPCPYFSLIKGKFLAHSSANLWTKPMKYIV